MKISELDLVFSALRERFLQIGLLETKSGDYSREFEKPNLLKVEFVSERYDPEINVLVSGSFSNHRQLVLGILANAVGSAEAKDIRLRDAKKHGSEIVAGVLSFLEKHGDDLVQNPGSYLVAYAQSVRDLRVQHGLKT